MLDCSCRTGGSMPASFRRGGGEKGREWRYLEWIVGPEAAPEPVDSRLV